MKRITALFLALILIVCLMCGCGSGKVKDGTYTIETSLEGGTGKAYIKEAEVTIAGGIIVANITWSSSNYDFMVVDGDTILPLSIDNGSCFEFPIKALDEPMDVQADTVAMSTPHLIDYTITFNSSTMKAK